jgi:hypothetical protein
VEDHQRAVWGDARGGLGDGLGERSASKRRRVTPRDRDRGFQQLDAVAVLGPHQGAEPEHLVGVSDIHRVGVDAKPGRDLRCRLRDGRAEAAADLAAGTHGRGRVASGPGRSVVEPVPVKEQVQAGRRPASRTATGSPSFLAASAIAG